MIQAIPLGEYSKTATCRACTTKTVAYTDIERMYSSYCSTVKGASSFDFKNYI